MPRLKPKYRVGDKVENRRGTFTIIDRKYRDKEIRTTIHIFPETWLYKLDDGRVWFFAENTLKSAIECVNCGNEGWDWIYGCEFCGLSPDDVCNSHTTDIY